MTRVLDVKIKCELLSKINYKNWPGQTKDPRTAMSGDRSVRFDLNFTVFRSWSGLRFENFLSWLGPSESFGFCWFLSRPVRGSKLAGPGPVKFRWSGKFLLALVRFE